jgi:hypothetical protein
LIVFDKPGMVLTDDPPLYRDLMRFKPEGLTPNGWAVRAGVSRTVWSDMRRHGNPSRRTLEKLLAAAGSSLAEFEALRIGSAPAPAIVLGAGLGDVRAAGWRPSSIPPVPLLESFAVREWHGEVELLGFDVRKVIGQVERPARLASDRNAYALTMIGEAMWPRFRSGRRLLVSPATPIVEGDDVLVQLARRSNGKVRAMIGELVRRTSAFVELRIFNPDTSFRIDADRVAAIQKVVGEAL